ncbi:hypothetical protein N7519_000225 [Penicillium mononematosum]|uniref:uncharacterized protein n=1 Tax=Penicillium mononematosum TaxID=268346 RepID=UPI0025497EAF|nr:uncharacterized protein N7519_000225 [Penicillium mononematosum]KAJ6190204.1 hypothetical protein N7519_000225 [Penicillium mononematosum]
MTARLVLVIGDLFIPDRAPDLPAKFRKLLTPGKIGQTLCLGNLTDRETYDFLREVARTYRWIVNHGSLRIGFTHGHTIVPPADADALLIAARQMDVDVLLWGGTHRFEAFEMEGRFFINPGSATGAMSSGFWPDGEEPTPSFCLMDIQGDVLVLYVYQLKTDANGVENVAVEKVSFRKNHPPSFVMLSVCLPPFLPSSCK